MNSIKETAVLGTAPTSKPGQISTSQKEKNPNTFFTSRHDSTLPVSIFFSCESISKTFLSSSHRLTTDSLLLVLLTYHNIASSQLVTSNRQRENMSRRSGTTSNDATSPVKDAVTKAKATELAVDNRHFSMIRALHMADLITELNGFCGAMSIFSSLRYCLGSPDDLSQLYIAMTFMPFGLFFDFMDGKVARWRKKSSLMGQELDSLADLISFGMAPASCAFALGFRTFLDTIFLTFFVLCGLSRLARFNVTVQMLPKDATGKSKYFEGTPIPTTLSIVSLMAYWASKGWLLDSLPLGTIGTGLLEFHPAVLIFCASGCAMVSKSIHIPKL